MNLSPSVPFVRSFAVTTGLLALVIAAPTALLAASDAALLDDFSDARLTSAGAERVVATDKDLGSMSQATTTTQDGVLTVQGELVPGRGVPAFISVVLPLAKDWQPQDRTTFEGVRIRVKITKGILSVQVGSAEITNFDYHTSAPITGKRGEFVEVRLPFKDMKRAWSEQTALNLKTITSVNLVAFGMAKDAFAYEVDEIGFY